MAGEYKVPLTNIKEILPHNNATSLEFAVVYGFKVIVTKGKYKVGDEVIYVPIDSLLPQNLENKLFPPDSKIKLNKHRIKQIKIRGEYSQGLLIDVEDVVDILGIDATRRLGTYEPDEDLAERLGITKYDPPQASYQGTGSVKKRDKPKENPYFHKYGGIDNFKWYPDLFIEGEMVSVTEKIHGSNIRFGYVPYVANNLWRKLLRLLGLTPKWEWVYGSNNVQLQQRSSYTGFYGEDVYGKVLEKYKAKDKVKEGEIWYGELYGDGIQGGYHYGLKQEHGLVVFDLKLQSGTEAKYVDADEFHSIARQRGFESVPTLYRGPFNKEEIQKLTQGDSVFRPVQKVREGVVIKPLVETESSIGRKLLKLISEKYLEKEQTEFH